MSHWCHQLRLHSRLKNIGTDLLGIRVFLVIFLEWTHVKLSNRLQNSRSLDYLDQILCWYRFQCFHQSKRFVALSFLVIIVFKMFYIYIWWIGRFPIFSFNKLYPCLSKMFFFWERENGCFFFTCVVRTTIHHTAPKNHVVRTYYYSNH